MSRLNHLIKTI